MNVWLQGHALSHFVFVWVVWSWLDIGVSCPSTSTVGSVNMLLITVVFYVHVGAYSSTLAIKALNRCLRFISRSWPRPHLFLTFVHKKCCGVQIENLIIFTTVQHTENTPRKEEMVDGSLPLNHIEEEKRWYSTFLLLVFIDTLCSAVSFWLCRLCKSWVVLISRLQLSYHHSKQGFHFIYFFTTRELKEWILTKCFRLIFFFNFLSKYKWCDIEYLW